MIKKLMTSFDDVFGGAHRPLIAQKTDLDRTGQPGFANPRDRPDAGGAPAMTLDEFAFAALA